ncbi:MAG: TonB-dependent receptor [Thermoanaerobaculia bacterium]
MRKRSAIVWALALAVLCAWPAMAQEQVGAIAGQVTDAEGGVLPGATVEVTGPGIGTLVSTTDERGNYRFPRVPPGVYTVTTRIEGFQPAETTGASITLGTTTTVNFELQVGEFTEEILVTGERAQIDVTQSATAVSIAREQIEFIPRGRDFSDVVTQAPGVNQEDFLGAMSNTGLKAVSVDGASGAENRFVIDGVEVTDPDQGLQGMDLRADFVEEVQVQTAGYDAEYGGAVGGVINVITKSGGNEFHGSLGVDYEDRDWGGDERPTDRIDAATVCGRDDFLCDFPEDDRTQLEPAFSLGGPIARDKAWFFVAYQRSTEEIDRTPFETSQTSGQDNERDLFTGNIKGNLGSQFLYRVSANRSPYDREGALPDRSGSTPLDANLGVDTDFPNENYSAYADYVPTNDFYLTGRIGYYKQDREDAGIDDTASFFFSPNSPEAVGLPTSDPRFRDAAFLSVPTAAFNPTFQDEWQRQEAQLAGNLFAHGAGDHAFKAGVQYAEIENNVLEGENGNLYRIRWGLADRFGAGVQGDLGSVEVRSFKTVGDGITSENLGFFIQDQWAVLPNLTLNLGVRAEQERIPNYPVNVPEFGQYAIEFDYDDKIAPRVGFAWDVLSDQRWKLYGSYGTYYDITKLAMPRGSFGGDQWISYLYPLDTFDWETLDDSCHISTNDINDNVCPALGDPVAIDLRAPSNPADSIDPDLKPMEQREIQLGLEHQLTTNIVLGARYVNKELQETIEDIGFRECVGTICQETFIIGNPGKGVVAGDTGLPPQPEAVRDYDALTLSFERRFVDNWSLRAQYTYSELEGNYSGLASSDEFGRSDPNVERYFDALHNGYDQNGNLVIGPLNTDRPNQIKVQGLYRTPWGTVLGLNQRWAEGAPISEEVSYAGVPFFPHGRESEGRLDDLTATDLQITHPFKIGGYELELALNVLNLFDEDTVVRVDTDHYLDDLCSPAGFDDDACGSQDFFFGQVPFDTDAVMADATENPLYLRPVGTDAVSAFQRPREVRVSATFRF